MPGTICLAPIWIFGFSTKRMERSAAYPFAGGMF